MSSRMRETKGHTGNRRSHHKVEAPRLSVCSHCKEYHKRHYACSHCGHYRGRQVIAAGDSSGADKATVQTVDEEQ